MTYYYHTANGKAVLNKGVNCKLKLIGKFNSEQEANKACEAHYNRVCAALTNFGKNIPQAFYL
jgi:hypothetical protein